MKLNRFATFAVFAGIAAASSAAIKPPVFSDMPLDEARRAAGEQKILLVDATADWCPPCQMMDQTTWVDDRLVEWIESNAVAIQLDVDEEPELARELRIRAMPTVIAYRGGDEFDRVVGYRDADQMLAWLEGVKQGERAIDRLREQAGNQGVEMHAHERAQLAAELLQAGEYDEATNHFVQLWEMLERREPAAAGIRSMIELQIGQLVSEHEPARQQFIERRDRLEAELRQEPQWGPLRDWLSLNIRILADHEPVIAWADRITTGPEAQQGIQTLRRFSAELQHIFNGADRLDLSGMIITNPLQQVATLWQTVEMVESPEGVGIWAMMEPEYDVENMEPEELEDPALQKKVRAAAKDRFLLETGRIYTSLLAARRHQEATEVAEFIFEKLDEPQSRLALIRSSLDHGYASSDQLHWLEGVQRQDEELAAQARELQDRVKETLEHKDREQAPGEFRPGEPLPPLEPDDGGPR